MKLLNRTKNNICAEFVTRLRPASAGLRTAPVNTFLNLPPQRGVDLTAHFGADTDAIVARSPQVQALLRSGKLQWIGL